MDDEIKKYILLFETNEKYEKLLTFKEQPITLSNRFSKGTDDNNLFRVYFEYVRR